MIKLGIILIVVIGISMVAMRFVGVKSDFEYLSELKATLRRAPKLPYPKTDLRGRSILKFNQLVILPDCNSCFTFRSTFKRHAESNPSKIFLVISPDMNYVDQFKPLDNCYLALAPKTREFAMLTAGYYNP